MLYVAKVLARALREKFPHVAEKDVLKVIGNLIYYRYINPTIVSPDAFDIISVSPTQCLQTARTFPFTRVSQSICMEQKNYIL